MRLPAVLWFLGAILTLSLSPALAHWNLNNAHSQLSFVSIKAGDIGEVHHFNSLEGSLDNEGNLKLTIDLTSVDTMIQIRDERMQKFLFNVAEFPSAEFRAQLDPKLYNAIPVGSSNVLDVTGTLSLVGVEQTVSAKVLATRVGARSVVVSSLQPVVLNAGAFKLTEGVNQLREIAGLPSISLAVPVTFVLSFSG